MNGRIRVVAVVLLWSSLGCGPGANHTTSLVPNNPFSTGVAKTTMPTDLSPDSEKEAKRVAVVYKELLDSNPQLPIKPQIRFAGGTAEEIFHRGSEEIFITEGLSRKCGTNGQLSAVFAYQLGKLISEREALHRFRPNVGNGLPPEVQVGTDCRGSFGFTDATRMMEVARVEQEQQRRPAIPPKALAQGYLEKAGLSPELLTEVAPLLKAAENNVALEKQITKRQPFPIGH